MNLEYVAPPLSRSMAKRVRALLQPALDHAGDTDWADVATQIGSGRAQLWIGTDDGAIVAACVTRIITRRGDKWLEYWLTGGDALAMYRDWDAAICRASREIGCVGATINGRAGWERALPDYRKTAVTLEWRFA